MVHLDCPTMYQSLGIIQGPKLESKEKGVVGKRMIAQKQMTFISIRHEMKVGTHTH